MLFSCYRQFHFMNYYRVWTYKITVWLQLVSGLPVCHTLSCQSILNTPLFLPEGWCLSCCNVCLPKRLFLTTCPPQLAGIRPSKLWGNSKQTKMTTCVRTQNTHLHQNSNVLLKYYMCILNCIFFIKYYYLNLLEYSGKCKQNNISNCSSYYISYFPSRVV